MTPFSGISAFPITPTDQHGRTDAESLARILAPIVAARVDAIGLLGSTGGYAYLGLDERKRVLELAIGQVAGAVPLFVGVSALRTDHAVDLARHAAANGADGLLLAPMSYTPLTEDEVHGHFLAVADATDLPICIYNNPSTTHFRFSVELLQRLAQIDTVRAVKMPLPEDGDFATELTQLRTALPQNFVIGYSGDWGAERALRAGADGFFSVAAGIFPKAFLRLGRAAMQDDHAELTRISDRFAPLWNLFQTHGSLRVCYRLANALSLTVAQPPRPILPMPSAGQRQIERVLDTLRPLER